MAILFASLSNSVGTLRAAGLLHDILIHSSMRWTMAIFDTTPIGRILNRFSNDIQVLDNYLPQLMYSMMFMLFSVTF